MSHQNFNQDFVVMSCEPQINTRSQHIYAVADCYNNIDNGFSSHIRGKGSALDNHTHIFSGNFPLGNTSGANGPIYISNPDSPNSSIIQLKRRFDGTDGDYRYWKRFY